MERNNDNARIVKKKSFLRNKLIHPRARREIKLMKIKFDGVKIVKRKLRKFDIDVGREAKKFCTFDNERFIIIFIILTQINPSIFLFYFFPCFNKSSTSSINCGDNHDNCAPFARIFFYSKRIFKRTFVFLRLQDAGTTGFHLHRLK